MAASIQKVSSSTPRLSAEKTFWCPIEIDLESICFWCFQIIIDYKKIKPKIMRPQHLSNSNETISIIHSCPINGIRCAWKTSHDGITNKEVEKIIQLRFEPTSSRSTVFPITTRPELPSKSIYAIVMNGNYEINFEMSIYLTFFETPKMFFAKRKKIESGENFDLNRRKRRRRHNDKKYSNFSSFVCLFYICDYSCFYLSV